VKSRGLTGNINYKSVLATLLLLLAADRMVSANRAEAERVQAKQQSEFEVEPRDASANPAGLSFTIRLADGKREFRQGEIIRIELNFSSSKPKKYGVWVIPWDRRRQLNLDHFHVDPADGVSDPMYDHFHSVLGLMWGGGGSSRHVWLEEKPYRITYDLNEWLRFDRPGIYRLSITSSRVSTINYDNRVENLSLTSNTVEFGIIPAEKDWQEEGLQRVIQMLDAKDRNAGLGSSCRELRFLGSKAAAAEMVRRYGDSDNKCGFENYAGLIGSTHREFVIDQMESRLVLPDQPVSKEWLDLLTMLVTDSRRPRGQPGSINEDPWSPQQLKYHEQARAKYVEQLAQMVSQKTGRARVVSVKTLLDLKFNKWAIPDAATIFDDLSTADQKDLLEYRWEQVAGPAMLPVLRRLYRKSESVELTTWVLRRIYDLAPGEGRQLIITELRKPNPRVYYHHAVRQKFKILPDEMLPELDSVFVDNFEGSRDTEMHSALIERYGSPNIFGRVKAILDERIGKMACTEQSLLLAYCLRVDASESTELIRRALNAREKDNSRCYSSVFRSVGEIRTGSKLEKLAIEYLEDSDPEVVSDAIAFLGLYGSADTEEPLWLRFVKWHKEWNGRERELNEDVPWQRVEQNLQWALSHSPVWLADPKKLERLKQLCLTPNSREQVDNLIRGWTSEIPIRIALFKAEWGNADVAQYNLRSLPALKNKLAQFPTGTIFKWQPVYEGIMDEEKEKLFQELESFLLERGIKLIK